MFSLLPRRKEALVARTRAAQNWAALVLTRANPKAAVPRRRLTRTRAAQIWPTPPRTITEEAHLECGKSPRSRAARLRFPIATLSRVRYSGPPSDCSKAHLRLSRRQGRVPIGGIGILGARGLPPPICSPSLVDVDLLRAVRARGRGQAVRAVAHPQAAALGALRSAQGYGGRTVQPPTSLLGRGPRDLRAGGEGET